jgi:ADP-L-glycero-D-manno-heptose 6-epimerase
MKILVTGHRGFIGGALTKKLSQYHTVTVYDYQNDFPNIQGYDWVIHAGAISSTTERDIELILRQNLDFSCRLLEACYRYGVNLQYSSSASIYGLGRDFKETALPDPRTPYAWSKYLFERHVAQNPGPAIVQGFRYFNVYGEPDQEAHKGGQASPFTQFRIQAQTLGRITLFNNSDQYHRDFVPIEQVVGIHKRFLDIPESGLWNIGTGQTRSFEDVAREVSADTLCAMYYRPMPKELEYSYQTYTCADLTHLYNTLEKYDAMG